MSSALSSTTTFDPTDGKGHTTFVLQGRYRLDEEIARGGSGIVYRAWDQHLEREVAIKILRDAALQNEHARARFRLEATAAAGLAHPRIVRVYEISEDREIIFLAMEYVEGPNLAQLTKDGPLSAEKAAILTKEAAEAVQCAHDAGVLHRDLKPSNVLVGPDGHARLTDFGLARRDGGDGLTLTGDVMGTPGYMAPEQASGAAQGSAVDIYSLGALLYHLLTGRAPYVGENHTVVLRHMTETDPLPPRLLNPETPKDLQTICLKALERDPALRYGSAQEIVDELNRFQQNRPILARPVSAVEHAWRWCRRKPLLAATLLALTLALTGFVSILLISSGEINGLKKEAEERLYASDMRLALQNIAEGKLNAAMTLLERHRPTSQRTRDLRNFEWYHAQELCKSQETAALNGLTGRTDSLAFSPDGKIVAAGADQLCLWRLPETTPFITRTWSTRITSLAFSADGNQLAIATANGTLHLLNMEAGKEVEEIAQSDCHTRNPTLAWNADGHSLTVIAGNQYWQWNPKGEQSLNNKGSFPLTPWSPVVRTDAATTVFTTLPRWDCILLDLHTGLPLDQLSDPENIARSAALADNGTSIAIGYFSGLLRVYNINSSNNKIDLHSKREKITARSMINVLTYSNDAQILASAANGTIHLWDSSSAASLKVFNGHHHTVRSLAFSPDQSLLASGDERGQVKIWQVETSEQNQIISNRVSVDGSVVIQIMSDDSLKVIPSSGKQSPYVLAPDPSLPVKDVKSLWNTGGVFGLANPVIVDFNSGQRDHSLPPEAKVDACSPDGRWIYFTLPPDNAPRLWDRQKRKIVLQLTPDVPNPARMSFSADSCYASMGYRSGLVQIYDLTTLRLINEFKAHDYWAYSRAFSFDGKHLATSGMDGKVKLWDWRKGELLSEFTSSAETYWSVALSPDGCRIAAGTAEANVVLWDIATGLECGVIDLGIAPRTIEQLCFTSDGSTMIAEHLLLHAQRNE